MTNLILMAEMMRLISTSQTAGMIIATNSVRFETNVTTHTDSGTAAPSSQFRERWISSNVWRITTLDFLWNNRVRQVADRELVTNHVWHIKEKWEVVK